MQARYGWSSAKQRVQEQQARRSWVEKGLVISGVVKQVGTG